MRHEVEITYLEPHSTAEYSSKSSTKFYGIREATAHVYFKVGEMNKKGGKFTVKLNNKIIYDSSDKRFNPKSNTNS